MYKSMFLARACRSHNPICIAQLSSLFLTLLFLHTLSTWQFPVCFSLSLSLFPPVFYHYNPERPPDYSTYFPAVRALFKKVIMYSRKVLKPLLSAPGWRYGDELDMNIHSLVLPLCNTTVSPNIHKLCVILAFSTCLWLILHIPLA